MVDYWFSFPTRQTLKHRQGGWRNLQSQSYSMSWEWGGYESSHLTPVSDSWKLQQSEIDVYIFLG